MFQKKIFLIRCLRFFFIFLLFLFFCVMFYLFNRLSSFDNLQTVSFFFEKMRHTSLNHSIYRTNNILYFQRDHFGPIEKLHLEVSVLSLIQKLQSEVSLLSLINITTNQSIQIQSNFSIHFMYGMWDPIYFVEPNDGVLFEPKSPSWLKKLRANNKISISKWIQTLSISSSWKQIMWDRSSIEQLLNLNPLLINQLETKDSSLENIIDFFSWIKLFSARMKKGVLQADLYRYLVIYLFGGFYFDLDCQPSDQSLNDLLVRTNIIKKNLIKNLEKITCLNCSIAINENIAIAILFVETTLSNEESRLNGQRYAIRRGVPEAAVRIANYALGSNGRGHPFWLAVLLEVFLRCSRCPSLTASLEDYDVLFLSGPDVPSTIWGRCQERLLRNASTRLLSDIPADPAIVRRLAAEVEDSAAVWCRAVLLVPHPQDQHYFRHDAAGQWRGNQAGRG